MKPITKLVDSHPRLPVMVWLHGGGFSFGSGNAFLYGPDFLVAEDVVLVTLNYRLGPLGFLSVGGDASGNAGLKVSRPFRLILQALFGCLVQFII